MSQLTLSALCTLCALCTLSVTVTTTSPLPPPPPSHTDQLTDQLTDLPKRGGGGEKLPVEIRTAALEVVLRHMERIPQMAALPAHLKMAVAHRITRELLDLYVLARKSSALKPTFYELFQHMRVPNGRK